MTHAISSARIGELYSEIDRFFDFAGLRNDPPPVRGNPDYRDPPAPKYPMKPEAKAALSRLNHRARAKDFFKPKILEGLKSYPREPGKAPPPPPREIWENAGAELRRLNLVSVKALEEALERAKERNL